MRSRLVASVWRQVSFDESARGRPSEGGDPSSTGRIAYRETWELLRRGLGHGTSEDSTAVEDMARYWCDALTFVALLEASAPAALKGRPIFAVGAEPDAVERFLQWEASHPNVLGGGAATRAGGAALDRAVLARAIQSIAVSLPALRLMDAPAEFLGAMHEVGVHDAVGARGGRRESTGVHYTPLPLVRYMTRLALHSGYAEEAGATPGPADGTAEAGGSGRRPPLVRLIDPAVGTGYFLFEALRQLLRAQVLWARAFSVMAHRTAAEDFVWRGDEPIRPSTRLAMRVIDTCLFGMDIDVYALRLTRLGLLLTVAGETMELPAVGEAFCAENLRCGDALREEFRKWPNEPMDVVLGNPPYGTRETHRDALVASSRTVWRERYAEFYRCTLKGVLKENGWHVFVVPDALLARDETAELRSFLAKSLRIDRLCHVGRPFAAGVSCVVVVGQPRKRSDLTGGDGGATTAGRGRGWVHVDRYGGGGVYRTDELLEEDLLGTPGSTWAVDAPPEWFGPRGFRAGLEQSGVVLGDLLCDGPLGITRGEELGAGRISRAPTLGGEALVGVHRGSTTVRYGVHPPDRFVSPRLMRKSEAYYRGPKIHFVKTGAGPVAGRCLDNLPALQSLYVLHLRDTAVQTGIDDLVVVAVLCSAAVGAYAFFRWTSGKLLQPQLTIANVRRLPVPALSELRRVAAPLRVLAQQVEDIVTEPQARARSSSRERIGRIGELESAIDRLVWEAFGMVDTDWTSIITGAQSRLPFSQRSRGVLSSLTGGRIDG